MTQTVKQNKNQAIFNHLAAGKFIRPGVKDITACFHPDDLKEYPGVYAMASYAEAVNRNNNSFNTARKITGNARNGAMMVFPADYQNLFGSEYISTLIDDYTHKMKLEGITLQIGKNFSGSYTANGSLFNAVSFTAELAGADFSSLLNLAADLAYHFKQKHIVVRDFANHKTYLINGIK